MRVLQWMVSAVVMKQAHRGKAVTSLDCCRQDPIIGKEVEFSGGT